MKKIILSVLLVVFSLNAKADNRRLSMSDGILLSSEICLQLAEYGYTPAMPDCVKGQKQVLLDMAKGENVTAAKMITSICSQDESLWVSSLCLEIGIGSVFGAESIQFCPVRARSRFGQEQQEARKSCMLNFLKSQADKGL